LDGSDFIRVNDNFATYGTGDFFCSRRFVELAKENQWSNLNFSPIDVIADGAVISETSMAA